MVWGLGGADRSEIRAEKEVFPHHGGEEASWGFHEQQGRRPLPASPGLWWSEADYGELMKLDHREVRFPVRPI